MKQKYLAAFFLSTSAAVTAAYGQSDGWISVTESVDNNIVWEAKKGTYELTKNSAGEEISLLVGKLDNKKTKEINIEKWYVATADCKQGFGKIVTLDLNGKFQYENSFAEGAGNIATAKAMFICAVYKYGQKKIEGKSL